MSELRIAVLTVSDSCSIGEREDESGRAIVDACAQRGWDIVAYDVCSDEPECIVASLLEMADAHQADVILTTGGTGLGPRDNTPEATMTVADRTVPGVAEYIRHRSFEVTPRAMLSRAVAAQRGSTLIINLPGSAKAVRETLGFVIDQFEHAAEMMAGGGHG